MFTKEHIKYVNSNGNSEYWTSCKNPTDDSGSLSAIYFESSGHLPNGSDGSSCLTYLTPKSSNANAGTCERPSAGPPTIDPTKNFQQSD